MSISIVTAPYSKLRARPESTPRTPASSLSTEESYANSASSASIVRHVKLPLAAATTWAGT